MLFDEVDGIFRGRDEDSKDLKRLLNSGYRTGATVLRTVGDQHEPKRFSTFSPKLLAGLGGLPDTLESRCVPIVMQRRLPHEQAERLLSARIDGERLSSRQTVALEHHLTSCAECRAFERGAYRLREAARFEVAPAVPDFVNEISCAPWSSSHPPSQPLRP